MAGVGAHADDEKDYRSTVVGAPREVHELHHCITQRVAVDDETLEGK